MTFAEFQPGRLVTTIGVNRRLRALTWMGYSPTMIAVAAGVHPETVSEARAAVPVFLSTRVKHALADAYERLFLDLTSQERLR